jgi:hypothetical protein
VFAGPREQRVDRAWLWREQLEPARDAAELPWVTVHTFRHICASILFAEGRNPKQVQMLLGHSDPGFTLRAYVHLIDDGLGDADFLDAASWATGGATHGATRATLERANAEPAKPGRWRSRAKNLEPGQTRASAGGSS